MKRATTVIVILALLCIANLTFATSGVQVSSINASPLNKLIVTDFRLDIPSLHINLSVVDAPFRSTTWDFSTIVQQAGHLEGLPLPGQGSNVVIGAHSELNLRRPGPFYHLPELKLGDDIIVTYGGQQYRYRVFSKWEVTPEKIRVLDSTSYEVLTLMTCSGYKNGQYATRLVVRAILVRDFTEVRQ